VDKAKRIVIIALDLILFFIHSILRTDIVLNISSMQPVPSSDKCHVTNK